MAFESPDEFKRKLLFGVHRRCFLQSSFTSGFYGRTEKRIEKLFKRVKPASLIDN
jgi:hypothetical protein